MKIEITSDTRNVDSWVRGTIDGREFSAKVSNERSVFGLYNGRIFKLWIYCVMSFNRGWDSPRVLKKSPDYPIYNEVRRFLENLPKAV